MGTILNAYKKGWTQYNYKVVRFEEVKTKLIDLGEINND